MTACLVTGIAACRQAYTPPAITAANHYLVVDGFINMGASAVTTFNLNRTRGLNDSTTAGIPELGAQIAIVSSSGTSYPLTDTANTGIYSSTALNLNIAQQYSISITTSNGEKYSSDPVTGKITPPIDSLYWQQPGNLNIYLNTHDPANNTRYYRFDYAATYQHNAPLQSVWIAVNGMLQATDSTNQKYSCWTTTASTNILIATSSALASDIINQFPVTTIPQYDSRLWIGYDILVHEYALTEDAYNYWMLIEQTSQNVGTLFDVQPTQLIGNIHCLTNPNEPVIGFISGYTVQQQRLFISNGQLSNWSPPGPYTGGCDTVTIAANPTNALIYTNTDTLLAPWYFDLNGNLVLASRYCLDCTIDGGTSIQPSFWP
jgi:hypothetical protein